MFSEDEGPALLSLPVTRAGLGTQICRGQGGRQWQPAEQRTVIWQLLLSGETLG